VVRVTNGVAAPEQERALPVDVVTDWSCHGS